MHFFGFKSGLKTGMYYLRTRPKAEPIKITVDRRTLLGKNTNSASRAAAASSTIKQKNYSNNEDEDEDKDDQGSECLMCGS